MSVRKRTWTTLGGGVALALTVTAAAAQVNSSANEMMPHCRNALDPKSPENLYAQGACAGTIAGIAFVAVSLNALSPSDDNVRRELCVNPPATGTRGQLVRIVVAYVDARPAWMHEPFNQLALEALRAAWPCK
jgi:hypothetical protein